MFTGIIEEVGTLQAKQQRGDVVTIKIGCQKILENSKIGDSISSNGICLTITQLDERSFCADLTPESLKRGTFAKLQIGAAINLERALLANSRLDGHMVAGHVDMITTLQSIKRFQHSYELGFALATKYQKFVIEKGSIAINGISLTVAEVRRATFSISVIPHTFSMTNLNSLKKGDDVNVEFDQFGKYLVKNQADSALTYDQLTQWGY